MITLSPSLKPHSSVICSHHKHQPRAGAFSMNSWIWQTKFALTLVSDKRTTTVWGKRKAKKKEEKIPLIRILDSRKPLQKYCCGYPPHRTQSVNANVYDHKNDNKETERKDLIFIDHTYDGLDSPDMSMTMMIIICTNWLRKLREKSKYFKMKLPCSIGVGQYSKSLCLLILRHAPALVSRL